MQSDLGSNRGDPLFSYNIAALVGVGLFVFLVGLALVMSAVIAASTAYFFEGLFSLVAFFGLYSVYKELTMHVRSASFYHDHFKISGWKFKKEFRYSEVDDLLYVKGSIRGGSLTISVLGEEDPIIIPSNPKNRSLRADLYSWLKQRKEEVKQQGKREK